MPAGAYTTLERPRRPIEEMNARRAAANRVEDMVRYNTESWISTERARWEHKTHATIKKRERTTRIRAMDAKAADGLRERRMRLATLLREEAEGWRKEVASRPSGDLVHIFERIRTSRGPVLDGAKALEPKTTLARPEKRRGARRLISEKRQRSGKRNSRTRRWN